MASYDNIINEFETVSNAFASVDNFIYNRVSAINGLQGNKGYPALLVVSTPNMVRGKVNNSFLPSRKEFTFNIFCYDLRNTDRQKSEGLQDGQARVDTILDQYIAELMSRNVSGDNGFSIIRQANINGFLAHDVQNDKLVQSTYSITVELDSDCIEGTFNY